MKKHILTILSWFLMYTCFAQSGNYTITCPENTFLGAFSCLNIADVPDQPGNLAEAMAAPYNIQIEGELPYYTRVLTEDDGIIFYCETTGRMVQRDIIFGIGPGGFEGFEEIARCSFTIETIPDLTPIEFIAPPSIGIACNVAPDPSNTGDVVSYENDCLTNYSESPVTFSDESIVEGSTATILRSWVATTACGLASEVQVQTITVNCDQNYDYTITCPENTFLGAFGCLNFNDVPNQPRTLAEATAAPYNIQIEGELQPGTSVGVEDDSPIFFCETNSRVVQRTVYFYLYEFEPGFSPPEVIVSCTYTIETIPDLTPTEFTAPPNIEIACGEAIDPSNTGDVSDVTQFDCPDRFEIVYADVETIDAGITTITRTWQSNNVCDLIVEKEQIITINCAPACNLRPPVITCD